ncbi:hypothetical protein LU674_012830 [Pseudomonas alloputida]|uniref:Pyocin activator protein PrtN n=1 Tax=Pseudomonas alloputida TaxID=1940621 RepID=A0AAW7HVI7_9PSED|nr:MULTISPECIES: hypothetical protein [Pseudomonas]MCE0860750.1 hypothetical protein [Pseudomonas alloputida]MCE0866773.1 hypothetical protein [Pseudomonas alloputida]MCE0889907.1 hypothetical protein [Pseudomonas alloputida]MCE0919118.1 hypothetical protein [Pseudomonas alloputida]MCE1045633.1 hypothetical protein [Pseudomonas alloputida]
MANATAAVQPGLLPRIIRAGDAPGYLGMCRDEFKNTVRPFVREFPIGKQGIGFDRLELDAWVDAYIEAMAVEKAADQDNNRPRSESLAVTSKENPWPKRQSQASRKCRAASGKSTKSTGESEFKKALALVTGKKQSNT